MHIALVITVPVAAVPIPGNCNDMDRLFFFVHNMITVVLQENRIMLKSKILLQSNANV